MEAVIPTWYGWRATKPEPKIGFLVLMWALHQWGSFIAAGAMLIGVILVGVVLFRLATWILSGVWD